MRAHVWAMWAMAALAIGGCDESTPRKVSMEVTRDTVEEIPGLGLDGRVVLEVAHVGFGMMGTRGVNGQPSVGNVTIVGDDELLAEDGLMIEDDTLRFIFDDRAFELELKEIRNAGDDTPNDASAVFEIQIL